jgi:hypothetical protein
VVAAGGSIGCGAVVVVVVRSVAVVAVSSLQAETAAVPASNAAVSASRRNFVPVRMFVVLCSGYCGLVDVSVVVVLVVTGGGGGIGADVVVVWLSRATPLLSRYVVDFESRVSP